MVKAVVLHYPMKLWFVYVCGLNPDGLVPGKSLTEEHVTKTECEDMFGGVVKGHNGYRIKDNPAFNNRVAWLWKRTHQEDGRSNNDFGLHFAQGLLYEYWGREKVDWATFALRSVTWFMKSKGLRPVHEDFKFANPTATID